MPFFLLIPLDIFSNSSSKRSLCFLVALVPLVEPGIHDIEVEIKPENGIGDSICLRQTLAIPPLLSSQVLKSRNLVLNSSFELLEKDWIIQSMVHFDQNVAHSGLTSLRVDKADFAAPNFYHVGTPSVPLAPDMQYVFGGWIKTEDFSVNPGWVSSSSNGLVWAMPRPSAVSFDAYGYGQGTQDWAMWSGRIATSSQPDQVSLTLFVSDFRSGSVWLDDVFVLPLYTVTVQ